MWWSKKCDIGLWIVVEKEYKVAENEIFQVKLHYLRMMPKYSRENRSSQSLPHRHLIRFQQLKPTLLKMRHFSVTCRGRQCVQKRLNRRPRIKEKKKRRKKRCNKPKQQDQHSKLMQKHFSVKQRWRCSPKRADSQTEPLIVAAGRVKCEPRR